MIIALVQRVLDIAWLPSREHVRVGRTIPVEVDATPVKELDNLTY